MMLIECTETKKNKKILIEIVKESGVASIILSYKRDLEMIEFVDTFNMYPKRIFNCALTYHRARKLFNFKVEFYKYIDFSSVFNAVIQYDNEKFLKLYYIFFTEAITKINSGKTPYKFLVCYPEIGFKIDKDILKDNMVNDYHLYKILFESPVVDRG